MQDFDVREQIIDGDGHLMEDRRAIIGRLDEPYRSGFEEGRLNAGQLVPPLDHLHSLPYGANGGNARFNVGLPDWVKFAQAVGITKSILYPSHALASGRIGDPAYAAAFARAYNDWVTETYVRDSSRLFGAAAIIPMQDPAAAALELRRAAGLGLSAGLVGTNMSPSHLGSAHFDVVWAEAQEIGIPISFHGGSHAGLGMDDFGVFAPAHALGHPFGLLTTMAALVFHGVFDRFPRLRVAFLEGGVAWVLLALERFSESFGSLTPYPGARVVRLAEGGNMHDYIVGLVREGRMVFGVEGGELCLPQIVDVLGCAPFMYSSDFPHVDEASCRHEIKELTESGLDDATTEAILGGTARRFYDIG